MAFGARGLFNCNSINVYVNTDRIVAYGAYAKGLKIVTGRSGIEVRSADKDLDWPSLSAVERDAVLTLAHERDHFRLLVGTPVGLLMWRCNETLVADIAFAMRGLAALGMERLPEDKSLIEWSTTDAEGYLAAVPAKDADRARQVQQALHNIRLVHEFREVMFGEEGTPTITVGAFLALANKAFPYLCRRWGLRDPPVWLARNSAPEEPLYPDREDGWAGTVAEIFEGSARLRERLLLQNAGADDTSIEAWERSHIVGLYRRSYRAFIHSFGSPEAAANFTFLSLLSPIDPMCFGGDVLYIEDALPHIRAVRLAIAVSMRHELTAEQVEAMKRSGVADCWCQLAGLPHPSMVLRSFLNWSESGVAATPSLNPILLPEAHSRSDERGSYIVVNLAKFRRGFQRSLSAILPVSDGQTGEVAPETGSFHVTPDIEFFSDIVDLGNYYRGQDAYNYHFNMLHYILSAACLSLLKPFRPLEDPSPLVAAFISRLARGLALEGDPDPSTQLLLQSAKADELTEEWRNIRDWWSSVAASNVRIGHYLRRQLGAAALRSVRFYPTRPGYEPDPATPEITMAFVGLKDRSAIEVDAMIPEDRVDSRINFADLLVEREENEGDTESLVAAMAAYQFALDATPRETDPENWALITYKFARALRTLGARQGNEPLLLAAVDAFEAVLEVRTREAKPGGWARTQRQLGETLRLLGQRSGDREVLTKAVATFGAALEETARDASPLDWGRTKMALGIALARLGEREKGSTRLLEARAAFQDALGELTADRVPLEWAMLQNNLGNLSVELGRRETGTARLRQAADAYRLALAGQPRDLVPLDWAQTQHNLGAVLEMVGERERDMAALEASISALKSALEVRTREHVPDARTESQVSLGAALETLGRFEANIARLEEAVATYGAAVSAAARHPVLLQLATAGLRRSLDSLKACRRA